MQIRYSAFLLAAVSVAAACGGAQEAPNTPASTTTAPAAASAQPGAEKPWDARSREEKLATMKNVVLPKMSAAFQAQDAARYKDFSCVTCHGPGAKQGKFDMPNPDLPKLSAKDGFKKHMDKAPEMTKFMMQTVVPQTAAAIGESPYDPATHKGFGCGECHTMEN